MTRTLAAVLAVSIAAAPLATFAPAAAEVYTVPFQGYCATDPDDFTPALGKIVRGPRLMEENEGGVALFTIEGTRVRAVGVALADGITLCILWSTLVEGDPS